MIRLQRIGRRNDAAYRIAVLEKARAARTGRIVEGLGSYNPKTKAFVLDEERAKEWMGQGAQPTDTLRNLFIAKGILAGKQVDVFPASARKKAREAAAKAAEEAKAAEKASAEAATAPVAAEVTPEASAVAPSEEAPVPEAAPSEVSAPATEDPSPVVESKDGTGPSLP